MTLYLSYEQLLSSQKILTIEWSNTDIPVLGVSTSKKKITFPQNEGILLEGCKISQIMLDSKEDKNSNWGNDIKRGPPNELKNYYLPKGWNGYGLKVINKYENNEWLSNENIEGEWYIAYYIIKNLNICKSIIEDKFNKNYHNKIYKYNENINPLSSYDYSKCEEEIYVFLNIN